MICKYCNKTIPDDSKFCPCCGEKVEIPSMVSLYFKKHFEFFARMNKSSIVIFSAVSFIVLGLLNGVFHILLNISLKSAILKSIRNIPSFLASTGLMGNYDSAMSAAYMAQYEKELAKPLLSIFPASLNVFLSFMLQYMFLAGVTFVIVLLLNLIILKKNLSLREMLLISIISYSPFVLSSLVISATLQLSFVLSALIALLGMVLSMVKICSLTLRLANISLERSYVFIAVLCIILVIAVSLIYHFQFSSALQDFAKTIKYTKLF